MWARSPAWLESREWAHGHAGFLATRAEERAFRFEHECWNPNSDTRREAKASIRRAVERELDAYLDRIGALAAERGFVPTPVKKTATGFEWLARIIVDDCSCSAIARELSLSPRAVQIAVGEAAEQAGVAVKYPRNWRIGS